MIRARAAIAALAALAVSPGCSGDDWGAGDLLVVGRMEVSPGITTVAQGRTIPLAAAPKTASGLVVPGRSVTWSSTEPGIASVSAAGLVTGVNPGGPVRIQATADGVTGEALVTVEPVPVDRITVTPGDAPLIVGDTVLLTATPFDDQNSPLTGRTILWESSAPSIASVTPTGAVIGQSLGEPVTITATTEGRFGTATVSLAPRPAIRLAVAQEPGPSTAGAPLSPGIRVVVQDDRLAPVIGANHEVTIALATNPGGATLGGSLTTTPVDGIATFDNLTLNRVGTGYTFTVASPGLEPATSLPFDVQAGPPAQFEFPTAFPGTGQSGAPLAPQPVVQLRDGHGNAVQQAGVQITATIAAGPGSVTGTTTAITNAAGVATFGDLAIVGAVGTYRLGFGAPGFATLISGPVVVEPGAVAALSIVLPPSAAAQNATPFGQQPAVQLADAAGNPVPRPGVTVTASLATGTGSLGGALSATTNGSGLAVFTSLAINGSTGVYTLRFSASGVAPVEAGPVAIGAGALTHVAVTVQPSATAQVGVPFIQQPSLQLRDASNNPVALAGVAIMATASTGGTLLGTTTATSNAGGVAAFTGLALSGPAGGYTLTFSAAGLPPATSNPIALVAGAAAQLAVSLQPPGSAQNGVPFPLQPQVQIRDGAGNPVSSGGVVITAALASGPGGTLGGTLTATTSSGGLATFSNLALSGPTGVYTLRFSSSGLTPVLSAGVSLGAGAIGLSITTQPSASAPSGVPFGRQPAVHLRGDGSSTVAQAGVVVTAAIATGGGTLGGSLTATTNASGLATFTNLAISGTSGARTLRFNAPGLTGVTSAAISITTGPATATRLAVTTQPPASAVSGAVLAPQPVVQLRDGANNPVAQAGVVIAVTVVGGAGTLGGSLTATTNGSGAASFTSLALSGLAGSYTLNFTSAGLTGATSTPIALSAGPGGTIADHLFTPSALTISTSEGAPYGEWDFWGAAPALAQSAFGYGPTKVVRVYICLSGREDGGRCSLEPLPTGPLSPSMLSDIDARIGAFTGTGIRLIPRFIYNFGPIGAADVPASLITTHIDQLAPILLRHRDLIFALQAGFIGTWGEWHSSTSGNDAQAARKLVLDRELFHFRNVFPIQLRYPVDLLLYTGTTTPSAQLGLHNDFYASSPDDAGTWDPRGGYSSQQLRDYAMAVSQTSMFVGEFGTPYPPLQDCSPLDGYSHSFNLQSILLFIPDEVAQDLQIRGCLLRFLNKVGTRIEIQRATITGNLVPGGTLRFALTLANAGYGRVIRARPATLVVSSGSSVIQQTSISLAQMDLRVLASAATPVAQTFTFDVTLPTVLPAGALTFSLRIPDPALTLLLRPAYALPLNSLDAQGVSVFDPATGNNKLATIPRP